MPKTAPGPPAPTEAQADAERAIGDLEDEGIDEGRIGVVLRDRDGQRELAEESRVA
jgi:hypothetical protein